MPDKFGVLNAVSILLQYSLVVFIYIFLWNTLKIIHADLRADSKADQPCAALKVFERGSVMLAKSFWRIEDTLTIGRGEENHIVINQSVVSHEHACIARQNNKYWLADLNSTNGTLLNNQPVNEEILLQNGDIIRIGTVSFKFER
ncbi:hypothetical protein P22_0284 [Propionispora sp. 2/2-37]|uniref:FHA domain-containing protein n=1 Tax=Propionispora sp. 2/2-37 TaxID=1677858 RepID=UPI0006BB82EA|nr:FHA domain-containing protein [Propionispora sp. 2/2-37]CUH94218.1 hypothetical protein P22_0284 [Propionispora sp. 2/2-37]